MSEAPAIDIATIPRLQALGISSVMVSGVDNSEDAIRMVEFCAEWLQRKRKKKEDTQCEKY